MTAFDKIRGYRAPGALAMGAMGLFLTFADAHGAADMADAAARGGKRPPVVADLVEMTRLVDPDAGLASFVLEPVQISPDGRYFAIATQRGDIAAGRNIYTLTVYDGAEALDYIDGVRAEHPTGTEVLHTGSQSNDIAISGLRWLPDGHTLAFIAALDDAPAQVFTWDARVRSLRQQTHHPRPIRAFDLVPGSNSIAYIATIPNRNELWDDPVFPVDGLSVHQIVQQGRENIVPRYQLYVSPTGAASRRAAGVRPLGDGFLVPYGSLPPMALSPDGRRLVVAASLPLSADDRSDGAPTDSGGTAQIYPCPQRPALRCAEQYVLYDLDTGVRQPLPQARAGSYRTGSYGVGVPAAHWLDDDRVLLGSVLVPASASGMEPPRPITLEVNVKTGATTPVTALPPPDSHQRLLAVEAEGPDRATLVFQGGNGDGQERRAFVRTGTGWREATEQRPATQALAVRLDQDYNQPPEIVGEDTRTGARKPLTDLNPQFRGLALGKEELFTWKDAAGADWSGTLILPSDYRPGVRYPLVIQTHLFAPHQFIADGAAPGPYAAQALAGKGMVVVQMGGKLEGFGTRRELEINRQGIEGLIDALDTRGLIDRAHVGLIGWSGLGMTVDYMMVFSSYPIAAATTADGDSTGMYGYADQYGRGAGLELMQYYEGMVGGYPWGDGLKAWVDNNPVFHLDKTHTPLLIEQLGGNYMSGAWDMFAILKRLNKPVEWLLYPRGTHVLVKPAERRASMQANVDWYCFWLKGEEDPDPAKAEQYARWRQLRQNAATP